MLSDNYSLSHPTTIPPRLGSHLRGYINVNEPTGADNQKLSNRITNICLMVESVWGHMYCGTEVAAEA